MDSTPHAAKCVQFTASEVGIVTEAMQRAAEAVHELFTDVAVTTQEVSDHCGWGYSQAGKSLRKAADFGLIQENMKGRYGWLPATVDVDDVAESPPIVQQRFTYDSAALAVKELFKADHGRVTRQQVQTKLGWTRSVTVAKLREAADRGLIQESGVGRRFGWMPSGEFKDEDSPRRSRNRSLKS